MNLSIYFKSWILVILTPFFDFWKWAVVKGFLQWIWWNGILSQTFNSYFTRLTVRRRIGVGSHQLTPVLVGWPDQYYRDTSQQYCQYYQYYRDTSQQYYQYNQYYRDTSWKGKMWKNALLTDLSCESLPTCPPSFRLPHKEDNAECCLNKLEPGCTFGAIFGVFDFCTF